MNDWSSEFRRLLGRTWQVGLASVALAALMPGCSGDKEDSAEAQQLVVGMLVEQSDTGDTQQELGAGLLAMRQINAAGGLHIGGVDYRLGVQAQDHQSTAAGTVLAMERLARQGVTATVGPPWSSLALGTKPDHSDGASLMARKYDMLLISPSATASAITDLADDDLQWRTIPSDSAQAEIAATELLSRKLLRAAVLYRDDAWGAGLSQAFQAAFEAGGGSITASVKYDPTGADIADLNVYDFGAELDRVFADQPDVVLLYNFDEVFQISSRIVVGDYLSRYADKPPVFFGSDANMTSDLLVNGAPAVIRLMEGTSPVSDASNPFYQKFEDWLTAAELDTADNTAAPRYDAIYCLALAMQKADSLLADDIKRELQAISRKDGDELDVHAGEWAEAKAALLAGQDVNYDGVSGRIEFSDKGDPTTGLYTIWKVAEGSDGTFSLDLSRTVPYGE
ncbi:MAG TPA: ABC transporter substrate-binding protein [Polyangiaceae bacterium]|nr:ABC transporter substrate-binding protein [Polyangiaceae bacterium]